MIVPLWMILSLKRISKGTRAWPTLAWQPKSSDLPAVSGVPGGPRGPSQHCGPSGSASTPPGSAPDIRGDPSGWTRRWDPRPTWGSSATPPTEKRPKRAVWFSVCFWRKKPTTNMLEVGILLLSSSKFRVCLLTHRFQNDDLEHKTCCGRQQCPSLSLHKCSILDQCPCEFSFMYTYVYCVCNTLWLFNI